MIRIDFIGAPGSGKTTLINELLAISTIKNASNLSQARIDVLSNYFSIDYTSISQRLKSFVINRLLSKNHSAYSKRKLNLFFGEAMEPYNDILTKITLEKYQNELKNNTYNFLDLQDINKNSIDKKYNEFVERCELLSLNIDYIMSNKKNNILKNDIKLLEDDIKSHNKDNELTFKEPVPIIINSEQNYDLWLNEYNNFNQNFEKDFSNINEVTKKKTIVRKKYKL